MIVAKVTTAALRRLLAGLSLPVLLLLSSVSAGDIVVTESWARESIPGTSSSALFASIQNTGSKDVTLVSVVVQGADKTELHATQDDAGMMRMRRLEQVVIPAGQTVSFEPGGYHVMLFRLAAPLRAGQTVAAEFRFANGEKAAASAVVRSARGADHHHHQH